MRIDLSYVAEVNEQYWSRRKAERKTNERPWSRRENPRFGQYRADLEAGVYVLKRSADQKLPLFVLGRTPSRLKAEALLDYYVGRDKWIAFSILCLLRDNPEPLMWFQMQALAYAKRCEEAADVS